MLDLPRARRRAETRRARDCQLQPRLRHQELDLSPAGERSALTWVKRRAGYEAGGGVGWVCSEHDPRRRSRRLSVAVEVRYLSP